MVKNIGFTSTTHRDLGETMPSKHRIRVILDPIVFTNAGNECRARRIGQTRSREATEALVRSLNLLLGRGYSDFAMRCCSHQCAQLKRALFKLGALHDEDVYDDVLYIALVGFKTMLARSWRLDGEAPERQCLAIADQLLQDPEPALAAAE